MHVAIIVICIVMLLVAALYIVFRRQLRDYLGPDRQL